MMNLSNFELTDRINMTSNFRIIWQASSPIWGNYESFQLLDNIHIVKVNIPKNIDFLSERKNLLQESDLLKLNRIVRVEDKNIFLASSVMKKILFGKYLNCLPEEVRFSENENKKPLLINQPDLHFNTSHSGDWLVFIFSNLPCGIDIEKIKWNFEFDDVMEYSFHPQEKEYVLKSANPHVSFFRIWTLKESLLKATGEGLIDNLHQLNLMEAQSNQGNKNIWHIKSFLVEDDYWCSICFQNPNSEIKFFEF
jgi:4'-phosphopantetheinyl transferase